jgi:hypothetical protein
MLIVQEPAMGQPLRIHQEELLLPEELIIIHGAHLRYKLLRLLQVYVPELILV